MAKRRKRSGTSRAAVCGECGYREALESVPIGLVVVGRDGAVRFSNRAASHLLGIALPLGCPVQDRPEWSEGLLGLSQGANLTRVFQMREPGGASKREIEARTAPMRWAGEAAVLVSLRETPHPPSPGRRWSPLVSVYRALRASAPVCSECGSPRIERNGAPGTLARLAGMAGHRCQDCQTVFLLPRRLALPATPPAQPAKSVEATGEEALGGSGDPVTPDALRALDQLLEALPKAETAPKQDDA